MNEFDAAIGYYGLSHVLKQMVSCLPKEDAVVLTALIEITVDTLSEEDQTALAELICNQAFSEKEAE